VPRTRSSHHNCRESDCELRVQSGTRIIDLVVSFDYEVSLGGCGKLGRASESGHYIVMQDNAPQGDDAMLGATFSRIDEMIFRSLLNAS
jgi:hypothetical protein